MRQDVRSPSAEVARLARRDPAGMRQSAAPRVHPLLRVLLSPFALLLAALAGGVFAILLPICGIATIAEAMARASWGLVRGATPHTLRQSASNN